jgi:ribonuclease Z
MARSPLFALHNPGCPKALSIAGHELVAFSISGVSTYVLAPAMDACFDLGHCAVEAARLRNVLLSHVHQDHSLGVVRHRALRQLWGKSPSKVYVPAESRDALVAMLRAVEAMEQREPSPTLEQDVIGVRAGETFALSKRLEVHAFDVVHRIASRGYTVIERRRSLKPQFVGASGRELRAARKRGEELYDICSHRTLTYLGDSTIETLASVANLGDCDVLWLEATHLGDTDPAVSAKYGHTHLDELVALFRERPELFGRAHIVLKHWSMRYGQNELRRAIDRIPRELASRMTALL